MKKRRSETSVNRTLNLMEMAREERRLHKQAHATEFFFGRGLAERMMHREAPRLVVSERVRDIVARIPSTNEVLDFRENIEVYFKIDFFFF